MVRIVVQFVGQPAGQPLPEVVRKAVLVPKRHLAWRAEARPDTFAHVGGPSRLPVQLSFASGSVGNAVRASHDQVGHPIAEPVPDVLRSCHTTVILDTVVSQCRDGQVLVTAVLQDGRGDREQMRGVGGCSFPDGFDPL